MSAAQEPASNDLEVFAAAVAHELRTPLAALSGEVDVALRRDRSPAAYRDALARIAAAVTELVELTGDLTFLGQPGDADRPAAHSARLDAIFARVGERYALHADAPLSIEPVAPSVAVVGDHALLTRALTLVVEHAVRHRRAGAKMQLRAAVTQDGSTAFGRVGVIVEAGAGAFWPQAWQCLVEPAEETDAATTLTGPLRLRTAQRIVRRAGGSLHATAADGTGGIHIRLRRAEPA